jgi:hypothetical protein
MEEEDEDSLGGGGGEEDSVARFSELFDKNRPCILPGGGRGVECKVDFGQKA